MTDDRVEVLSPLAVTAAALGALLVVSAVVVVLMQRDRAALVVDFTARGQAQVVEIAKEAQDGFDDIGEDLRFATALVDGADANDRTRELGALLAVVRQYRAVEVYDDAGVRLVRVVEPPPSHFDVEPYAAALRETALRALERRGDVVTSPQLAADPSGWYRVFSMRYRSGALAILIDTQALFQHLRVVTAEPSTRVLLLGAFGNALPASDANVVAAMRRPELESVLQRVLSPKDGAVDVPAAVARTVGLGDADVVVSHAPILLRGDQHWSVAMFRSTAALREQQQDIAWRLAAALGSLFVVFFGGGWRVMRSAQRTISLRERLRHAERLADLQTQLLRAEKLATVGILAAGMAHEIGTPLGIIRGRAEYVAGKLGEHPQAGGVRSIVLQIDRVTRLIRELLDFAHPRPTRPRPTDLRAAADSVLVLLKFSTRAPGVKVAVDVAAGLPLLAADPDHLQQVLVNLTLNACDACAEGGSVMIRAWVDDEEPGQARIVVADDGCGIPDDLLHRVFDPFFTTKKRGKGTGLGLSVVAQIAQSYGAIIDLDSGPGRGTRVTLRWPLAPEPTNA
ncbi:MAG: ATP-binding protein [Deltaproteobacteria bacterium]|nr:ATP-binding protein [Deltaproteobacteria bacterium]